MPNGDNEEWSIWRGEQTATLRLVKDELGEMNDRLGKVEREMWVLKGKSAAYGAVGGVVVSIVIGVILMVIENGL